MLHRYISANAECDNRFALKFSGRQFQCFYLYVLLGSTAKQTGEIMGISSGSVEQYIYACKQVLSDEGLEGLSNFELWREMYLRGVIKQYVTDNSACLKTDFVDIRTPSQIKKDPAPFILSKHLHPDTQLNGAMAKMMSPRQQQCGYLFMIGATFDQIAELMGFSRSTAIGHIKLVREGLDRFGMLSDSRLLAWLFFFGHNYIRQEVHPDSPLLKYRYNDIRESLGMDRKKFANW